MIAGRADGSPRMNDWRDPDPARQAAAEAFLTRHGTLHDLLAAGGDVVDVIVQDEYTHDVVATIPTDRGPLLAVFDST